MSMSFSKRKIEKEKETIDGIMPTTLAKITNQSLLKINK